MECVSSLGSGSDFLNCTGANQKMEKAGSGLGRGASPLAHVPSSVTLSRDDVTHCSDKIATDAEVVTPPFHLLSP